MTRAPEEVFAHHAQALGAGDLDEIVANHTTMPSLSPRWRQARQRPHPGGVHATAADVPNTAWDLKTQIYQNGVLFLE